MRKRTKVKDLCAHCNSKNIVKLMTGYRCSNCGFENKQGKLNEFKPANVYAEEKSKTM